VDFPAHEALSRDRRAVAGTDVRGEGEGDGAASGSHGGGVWREHRMPDVPQGGNRVLLALRSIVGVQSACRDVRSAGGV